MNYDQAFNFLDLRSLNDFVYQPVAEGVLVIKPDSLSQVFISLEEDPWKYLGLNFDWRNPFGITDMLNTLIENIKDIWRRLEDLWHFIWQAVGTGWKSWWNEIWETIRRMYYNFSPAFFSFTLFPWSWSWNLVYSVVKPLIDEIRGDSINIWEIIHGVYERIYSWLEPRLTTIRDLLWGKIILLWDNIKNAFDNLPKLIIDPIANTFSWLWETIRDWLEGVKTWIRTNIILPLNIEWIKFKTPFIVLIEFWKGFFGSLIDILAFKPDIWNRIVSMWSTWITWAWKWGKEAIDIIVEYLQTIFTADWFGRITRRLQDVFKWLEGWFEKIIRKAISLAKTMIPSAPERGEDIEAKIIELSKYGAMALGGMTGLSMVVSTLSKVGLGHLSAIIYDFTGYKYITGAIMGALTAAAFAIPLKYYYNSLFRPYLPKWEYILDLYNRGIIEEDELREFAKWYGFPDKYVWHFIRYVATPISLFRQPDMAVWDTSDKGELLEEMRFSGLEEAGCVQYLPALWLKAKTIWLTRMITEMMYSIRRGFALVAEMVADISGLRTGLEAVTSSGHRFLPSVTWTFKKMPETSEILDLISKWAGRRLSADGLVTAVMAEFREDLITEDEARTRLSEIIKVPELVEGGLAPIISRKKRRDEPEKGKDLRKELKGVISRCYKEGLITWEKLKSFLSEANEKVFLSELISYRSTWEAFYDDMMDWRKIYVKSLADGIITEAEFRRDLIDMGFRSDKVELLIRYDIAKKLGRVPVEKEKLLISLSKLEFRLKDLQSDLKAVEEDIAAEPKPYPMIALERKRIEVLENLEKAKLKLIDYESDLKAVEADLAIETEAEKITKLERKKIEVLEDIEKAKLGIRDVETDLAAVDADIEAEPKPEPMIKLTRKRTEITEDIEKVEAEISSVEERLRILGA